MDDDGWWRWWRWRWMMKTDDEDGWWRWMMKMDDEDGLMKMDDSRWWWMMMNEYGWRWMEMDEDGWKWMVKDDDDGWWRWMMIDDDGWRRMKMDEYGGRWMKMDNDGWRWMIVDDDGWRWRTMDEDERMDEYGWWWVKMDDDGWRWMKTDGDNDDDVFMSDPSIAQRPRIPSLAICIQVTHSLPRNWSQAPPGHEISPHRTIEQLGPTGMHRHDMTWGLASKNSRLPRFSCQIIHVGAKYIHIYICMYIYIYGQTNPDTNIMNPIQKLFSEFLKLEKESRSERHQQNMTIHYPNISVKPVKQCHDNKT